MEVDNHQRPPDERTSEPSTSSSDPSDPPPPKEEPPSEFAPPPPREEPPSEFAPPPPEDGDPDDHLMCRVCRGNEGSLYYPCLCTGSIKYVHQECLVEWLKYSKKEVCELCNHKYSFQPIYRPDMPKALPIFEILRGVCVSGGQMLKTWIVYTIVMGTWLGLVPLTAARIYNCIFYMSFAEIMNSPLHIIKVEHVFNDIMKGSILLTIFVCTFISLVWLREQIIIGGPQHFINIEDDGSEENENGGEEPDAADDDSSAISTDDEDEEDDSDSGDTRDTDFSEELYDDPINGPAEEAIIYIDGNDETGPREAVLRGHPAVQWDLARERQAFQERNGYRPPAQGRDPGPPYDDMRDDENEVVENMPAPPAIRHREMAPPPEDRVPPPMEPEPIVPRAAARANRRLRRERQHAELLAAAAAAEQEDNWREWDRFGDELTWQRLLGLDGSFIFLEHVFWVISLNTLFTILFAYVPYRFGNVMLAWIGLFGKLTYFPSIIAMLLGYVQAAAFCFFFHQLMHMFKLHLMYRFLGVAFLIIKVFLLVFLEIGFFPVMCGCWMDVCTLPLFNVTLSQRIATFANAPFMSIFLHWMVGMVYVFYSASFVILLREILRPGVLWFMRNLNDPDFNPIQEMIDLPFTRHFRRLVVSTTLFFSTILLIFYIPLNIISSIIPSLLPYNVSMSAETPLSELSLELLILQVIMPAILEHANGRLAIKIIVRAWCKVVGAALDLDQYLLSDNNNNNNQNNNNDPLRAGGGNQNGGGAGAGAAGGGLAAEHQALLLLREPRAYEPYERPSLFAIRISILLVLMAATTTLSSVIVFIVPVSIGRATISLVTGQTNVHEIYTAAIGLYLCWCLAKAAAVGFKFFQAGPHLFKRAVMHYSYLGMRLFFVALPIVIFVPLLMGTYFQLVFLTPLRLGYMQSPMVFPYQDWAMGVVQMKIFGVVAMMGPDWWLKSELELLVQRGVENFAALHVFVRVVVPCLLYLCSFIAFPVVVIKIYAFVGGADREFARLLIRFSYPAFLIIISAVAFIRWQVVKFAELAEKIKNDRYLVGTQLVNYEKNGIRAGAASASASASAAAH